MHRLLGCVARLAWPLTVLVAMAVTAIVANPTWNAAALRRLGWQSEEPVVAAPHVISQSAREEESVVLPDQGCWSAGVELGSALHKSYERSVSYPGIVRTCPGRSIVKIPAPLTGIVTRVYREGGEAVSPGQPLFEIALTHEELIRDQADYLAALQKRKILEEEIQRLEKMPESIMPRKDLLQRTYELRQVKAELDTLRQVLQLHRLPPEQIAGIEQHQKLVEVVTVSVPTDLSDERARGVTPALLELQELDVEKGQHVVAGETMCVIADHSQLQIEGSAFEGEAKVLHDAVRSGRPVSAVFEAEVDGEKQAKVLAGLRLNRVEDRVDSETRTVRFSVRLPNEELAYLKTDGHRRFIARPFKPGQRCRLQVSVETLADCLALPVSAVAEDRGQACVFRRDGNRLVLMLVKVLHRDQIEVVVDDKYQITPRDSIVMKGAGQLLAALRSGAALQTTCDCGQKH